MKSMTAAVAIALSTLALSASAMTPIKDAELSAVTGQDGVSIGANLNVNIGSFVYTDTDAVDPATGLGGGSVSFNNIKVTGLVAATIDILSQNSFLQAASAAGVVSAGPSYYSGGDVVQIAIPSDVQVNSSKLLSISVDSIKMGNNIPGKSFGSMAINQIDLRGTTVWIWAH
jgi:hypothetical protein